MNKNRFNLRNVIAMVICLTGMAMFSACDPEENNPPAISVADNGSLTQEVFADNTQGKSVSFTTTAAWTSSISMATPSAQSAQMRAASNSLDWISISPDHGTSAGNYTIEITLNLNTTGVDRTAIITISCDDTDITISVTQKSIKEDGTSLLPTYNFLFTVYEANEAWEAGDTEGRFLSENAEITLYRLVNNQYEIVDQILTSAYGKATYTSSYTDLFYTVTKAMKQQLYDDYLVLGIFTSQEEIASAAHYPNSGRIANPKPGSVKVADMNGDALINDADKINSPYFSLKVENLDDTETVVVREATIISPDFVPNNGIEEISLEELINYWYSSTKEAQNLYCKLDEQYSSETSRLLVTPALAVLREFWQKAYSEIMRCNIVLEYLEKKDIAGVYKDFKGECLAYRALVYFYLNTMFGGVPLVTSFPSLDNMTPSRATWNEVSDFIRANMDEAIQYLAQSNELTILCYQTAALNDMQKQDYTTAISYLRQAIDAGIIHVADNPAYFLLTSESYLRLGQNIQAVEYLNQVLMEKGMPPLLLSATNDEIISVIQMNFVDMDSGMKYLNAVRWGETASWGFRELLPIPMAEIISNPNMIQNPGW